MIFLVPNLFMHFTPCTHLHNDIHIDHGIEEQTQEQPLIEEPEDPEPYPQQEDLQQAADSAPDDTNPSEEGRQALHSPSKL